MSDLIQDIAKTVEKGVGIIAFPASSRGSLTNAFENSVYRRFRSVYENYLLAPKRYGDIVATRVSPRLIFCPMICIQGEFSEDNQHPLSFSYLGQCLKSIKELSLNLDIPVYIPQFYASPKKDKWDKIEKLIQMTSREFVIWKSENTLVLR